MELQQVADDGDDHDNFVPFSFAVYYAPHAKMSLRQPSAG